MIPLDGSLHSLKDSAVSNVYVACQEITGSSSNASTQESGFRLNLSSAPFSSSRSAFATALSPFGGPFAIRRRLEAPQQSPPSELSAVASSNRSASYETTVFASGTGSKLATFRDKLTSGLAFGPRPFGWTDDGKLISVGSDGSVSVFESMEPVAMQDPNLSLIPSNLLCPDRAEGVLAALVWDRGVCVVTSTCALVLATVCAEKKPSSNKVDPFASGDATATAPLIPHEVSSSGSSHPSLWGAPLRVKLPLIPERPPRTLAVLRPKTKGPNQIAVALPDQFGALVVHRPRWNEPPEVSARVMSGVPSPIVTWSAHPTLDCLACICLDGRLLVVDSAFERVFYARDASLLIAQQASADRLPSIEWIVSGEKELVFALVWSGTVSMHAFSTNNDLDISSIPAEASSVQTLLKMDALAWIGQCDGLGIVGAASGFHAAAGGKLCRAYLVRRASVATQSLLRIGSVDPVAMLVDALDSIDSRDHQGEAAFNALSTHELSIGVQDALKASFFELNSGRRSRLLRAARLGLTKLSDRKLRMRYVEALRCSDASSYLVRHGLLAATPSQILCAGGPSILARVLSCCQGRFSKVLRAAALLKVDARPVLASWACALVAFSALSNKSKRPGTNQKKDEEDFAVIESRLAAAGNRAKACEAGAAIALIAKRAARVELANRLCLLEPRLERRALGLLAIGSNERAYQLVESSRGVEALFARRLAVHRETCVIDAAESRSETPNLDLALRSSLRARKPAKLELVHLRESSNASKKSKASNARAFLLAEWATLALVRPSEAQSQTTMDPKKRIALLDEAAREWHSCGQGFNSVAARDYVKLVLMQESLTGSTRLIGRSVGETIVDCVARNREDLAVKFQQAFDVRLELYLGFKLRGIVKRGGWAEATKLVSSHPNILSNELLFDLALAIPGNELAVSSAAFQLSDKDPLKADTFVRLGMWSEAAKSGANGGHVDALTSLIRQCHSDPDALCLATEALDRILQNGGGDGSTPKLAQGQSDSALQPFSAFTGFVRGVASIVLNSSTSSSANGSGTQ